MKIKSKPKKLELILTGRNAPQKIIDAANLVTEMKMIKHPYYKNIPALLLWGRAPHFYNGQYASE